MSLDASLNGINFSTKYFEIGRYFDDLLPSQKRALIDIPGVPGYTQIKKKFLPREITIKGVLRATSSSQLITRIEDFVEFLYSDNDVQLIFNDKSDRYYWVQFVEKVELQKRGVFVPMSLKFIANDPFGYAVTADDNNENNITTKDHTWTISNGGQYYAYPVITITFNQDQTHIYIENKSISGNRFDISKAFSNGDSLEIDSKNMTIKLNGSNSPAGFGDGGTGSADFILLKKDDNTLQIGTDDASIDVDVNVNFRKVYL